MRTYTIFFLVLLIACESDKQHTPTSDSLFKVVSPTGSGIDFVNQVTSQDNFNVLTYRNYYNGGGVAVGDINNDGLSDIYFTANMTKNKLYINRGQLQFEDITTSADVGGTMAWSTGVTMADVNGDGWLDIYVCNSGNKDGGRKVNELFINNKNGTFSEQAAAYGLNDSGFSTHASFFDFDRDGDLDMYLVNNSFKDPSRIDYTNIRNVRDAEGGDKLFRNNGQSQFDNVSEEAGIYSSKIGFGLGVSVSDLNGDNWPDIYVSNDFWERDYLYLNQNNGTFSEELPQRIPVTSTSSMGADIADLDNNGTYEIFTTDMLPATNERLKKTTIFNDYNLQDLKYRNDYHYQYTQNCLQVNDGTANFSEVAHLSGVAATDWSWGALIFDFDNDGLKDIFVSNGVFHDITDMDFSDFIEDQEAVAEVVKKKGRFDFEDFLEFLPSNRISNYAFQNSGNLEFKNMAKELGLGTPSFSNGSAYGDLDNDGDLDLIVNNVNQVSQIFENQAENNGNHYIKINFKSESQNVYGIGCQVELVAGNLSTTYQNYSSRGFQSSTEPHLTIGIGLNERIDTLKVLWPSGNCTLMTDVSADQLLQLTEEENRCSDDPAFDTARILDRLTNDGFAWPSHKENVFNDFDIEPLMPHMVSTEGPEVLVGDLNLDGNEDYVLLGGAGQEDQILLQSANGQFQYSRQEVFQADASQESTCGLITDIDKDGDPDLVIGSGGNDPGNGPEQYLLRVYLNNGQGQFTKPKIPLLQALGNFSVIEEIRLSDNWRGIFLGGRIVPGNYGLDPRNYLFVQENSDPWVDVTTEATGKIGMVTDAEAVDLDQDGDEDLVVVGEWMPITMFENLDGILSLKGSVPNSHGLWQSVTSADINNDNIPDLIAGNWGNNSKLQASINRPLRMLVNDFDQNGKTECLIQWFAPEDDYPSLFASKNDLTRQLPSLKKVILKNAEYATKSIDELFTKDQINSSLIKYANNLESSVLINQGRFRFKLQPLPKQLQFSPVFSLCLVDLNNDQMLDLVAGGNMYGLKPEIGRLNSSRGNVLLNNGENDWEVLSTDHSGLDIEGEIRDINSIQLTNGRNALIFGINNQAIRIYAY